MRILIVLLVILAPTAAAAPETRVERLMDAFDVACRGIDDDGPTMAAALAARDLGQSPLIMRGATLGWSRVFAWPDSLRVEVEAFMWTDVLRRLTVTLHEPDAEPFRPTWRPQVVAVGGADCRILHLRALTYRADGGAEALDVLDPGSGAVLRSEPLDPEVPPPTGVPTVDAVRIAIVDAGVNYLMPEIAERLARDDSGKALGFDYWDKDPRPFDANPAASPFFPQRHGTRTASVLLREAPAARLVPYRYPRPDMRRMENLVADAAAKGVRIVVLPLGSDREEQWRAFAAAAEAHAAMLFIVSAGNNGRNIDDAPVYPAALPLDNMLVVTSAADDGGLAEGSNWGPESVDLMTPGENLPVIAFDGGAARSSGTSFAAPRIGALAARLLAAHPDWDARRLKAALIARAAASPQNARWVRHGYIAEPANASD